MEAQVNSGLHWHQGEEQDCQLVLLCTSLFTLVTGRWMWRFSFYRTSLTPVVGRITAYHSDLLQLVQCYWCQNGMETQLYTLPHCQCTLADEFMLLQGMEVEDQLPAIPSITHAGNNTVSCFCQVEHQLVSWSAPLISPGGKIVVCNCFQVMVCGVDDLPPAWPHWKGVQFFHWCFTGVGKVLSKRYSVVRLCFTSTWPGEIGFTKSF